MQAFRWEILQKWSTLCDKANSNLNTWIGWILKQHSKQLQGNDLMSN